jgi:hypothetical protein
MRLGVLQRPRNLQESFVVNRGNLASRPAHLSVARPAGYMPRPALSQCPGSLFFPFSTTETQPQLPEMQSQREHLRSAAHSHSPSATRSLMPVTSPRHGTTMARPSEELKTTTTFLAARTSRIARTRAPDWGRQRAPGSVTIAGGRTGLPRRCRQARFDAR